MVTPSVTDPVDLTCPACGAAAARKFAGVRDPLTGTEFSIEECTQCGLGWTTPKPQDHSRYYGDEYYGGRHGLTARYCSWRRGRWLAQAVPQGGALLDAGCGDGAFLVHARRRGWTVSGIEIDSRARAAAGAVGLSVVPAFDDIAAGARFDAITFWHSLEHFEEPQRVLADAHRALTPRGALLLAVPDAGGIQATLFRRHWFHLDVPRHLYHYTQDALERLLHDAGFAVERWRHQEAEYDTFGWIQSAINSAGATQNGFFASLAGKRNRATLAELALSYAAAIALAPAALAASVATSAIGRGGTLIAVARPRTGGRLAL